MRLCDSTKKRRARAKRRGRFITHISLSLDAKWRCAVILGFRFEEWNKCYYNRVYVEKLVNANLININCGS